MMLIKDDIDKLLDGKLQPDHLADRWITELKVASRIVLRGLAEAELREALTMTFEIIQEEAGELRDEDPCHPASLHVLG
jgi:hypothetical protein